ncbi:hypothetical protein A2U01_0053873 [Trifolium medium]|uniref:Uncharacterized protein n=1 Tax=Trifolium medium TaxID=97028 RepID=A0A392R8T7_9FABA|nr:hypothetical protein [Trifolium medium]
MTSICLSELFPTLMSHLGPFSDIHKITPRICLVSDEGDDRYGLPRLALGAAPLILSLPLII